MENRGDAEGRRDGGSVASTTDQAAAIAQPPKRKSLKDKISHKGLDKIPSYDVTTAEPAAPPVAEPVPVRQPSQPYAPPRGHPYTSFAPSWTNPAYFGGNDLQSYERFQVQMMQQIYQQAHPHQMFHPPYSGPRPNRGIPPPDVRPVAAATSYQKKRIEEPEEDVKEKSNAGIELLEKISDYPAASAPVPLISSPVSPTAPSEWDKPEKLPPPTKAEPEAVAYKSAFKKRSQSEDYEYIGDMPAQQTTIEENNAQESTPAPIISVPSAPTEQPPAVALHSPQKAPPPKEVLPSKQNAPAPDERYKQITDYINQYSNKSALHIPALSRHFTNANSQRTGIELITGAGIQRSTAHMPPNRPGPVSMMQRMSVSDDVLAQMKYMKEHADHWLVGKNEDDEEAKLYRSLKHTLNRLSPDNFETVSQELLDRCDEEKTVDMILECLVRKAWNEPVYTHWYAELVALMVNKPMPWDNSTPQGPKEKKKNPIKSKLLAQVEMKYALGFDEYHKKAEEIADDATLTPEDRQERLNKMRKILLGNMNFISELFRCKVLASPAIRWIVLYGISRFLNEFLQPSTGFSVKEDYLEALLKLFENSGELIANRILKDTSEDTDKAIIDMLERILTTEPELSTTFLKYAESFEKSVYSISNVFFDFLTAVRNCRSRSLTMRMDSLIENLFDFRDSGWKFKVGRVQAAKRLDEVHGRKVQPSAKLVQQSRAAQSVVQKWEDDQHLSVEKNPMGDEKFRVKLLSFTQLFDRVPDDTETAKQYENLIRSFANPLYTLLMNWAENVRNIEAMELRFQTVVKLFSEGVLKADALYAALPSVYLQLAELGSEQPKKHEALGRLFTRLREKGLIDLRKLGLQPEHRDIPDEYLHKAFAYLMRQLFEELKRCYDRISLDSQLSRELMELKKRFNP